MSNDKTLLLLSDRVPFISRGPSCSTAPWLTLAAAMMLSLALPAAAATIGINFLAQANDGGTNGNALAATDLAGAGSYAQMNWNNVAGAQGTNAALIDSSGG